MKIAPFRLPFRAALPALAGGLIAATAPGAGAQTPPELPPDTLAGATTLVRDAATLLAPHGARIVVLPGRLDARLKLAPCNRVDPYLPTGVPPWGATRVGLRCVDGAVRWNVLLPLAVQVWARGVVAVTALPVGTHLGPAQLGLAEIDWAASTQAAFADPQVLDDRVLARPLAAGQAVRSADMSARQWYAPGETVQVVASGAGFAISTEGQAVNAGIEGQPGRVRLESGRVLVGRPVGERRIEVGL